ncbi:MAG: bifunctional pyr operon transcriptional regulator/uracil phosphoribosyltransferase PyrR [Myxococcota bacterium]
MANDAPSTRVPSQPGPDALNQGHTEQAPQVEPRERVVLDGVQIHRALTRIAHEILESNWAPESLYLVAIPNGGVPLGRLLGENIESLSGARPGMGILDTTLYRDDLTARGTRPRLRKTEMPSSVDDRLVILVEDVVNTGRTIRAAMDALMDFGRPRAVKVVALVDRGHRELPIKIDHVGKNIPTQSGETVILRIGDEKVAAGAEPESLEVVVRSRPDVSNPAQDVEQREGQ